MPNSIERALAAALTDTCYFGKILIRKAVENGFVLCHRKDQDCDSLIIWKTRLKYRSGKRIAANISDEQINDLVGNFCQSNGRYLRTILWKRNESGIISSTKLLTKKFEPAYEQALGPRSATAATAVIPLLCQEACNLLVAAVRKVVKGE